MLREQRRKGQSYLTCFREEFKEEVKRFLHLSSGAHHSTFP